MCYWRLSNPSHRECTFMGFTTKLLDYRHYLSRPYVVPPKGSPPFHLPAMSALGSLSCRGPFPMQQVPLLKRWGLSLGEQVLPCEEKCFCRCFWESSRFNPECSLYEHCNPYGMPPAHHPHHGCWGVPDQWVAFPPLMSHALHVIRACLANGRLVLP